MKPLLHKDGSLHQFTLNVNGKSFQCGCGCNVFHKPDETRPLLYQCNMCDAMYCGEDEENTK